MIKTFRGQLAHQEEQEIRLSTNNGLIGYRVNKFQVFPEAPGTSDDEFVVKIYSVSQDTIVGTIDFHQEQMLAMGFVGSSSNNTQLSPDDTVIFDEKTFNQDIFVSAFDVSGGDGNVNYYLELEQIKLDLSEATVATLRDMRGTN
jgi:hypothetical protein